MMKDSLTMHMTPSGYKTTNGKTSNNRLQKGYNNLLEEFKREQTGYAAISIIGQSCLGSVAAMALLMNDWTLFLKMGLLGLVTVCCMAFNAAVLAQLNSKTTFNLLLLSVALSCAVIIANLI